MTLHKAKTTEFPFPTYEEWTEEAARSLKGRPFDDLFTTTDEGIQLKPLYTRDDYASLPGDNPQNQSTTVREGKWNHGWQIAQQINPKSESFLTQVKESLSNGNETIVFDGLVDIELSSEDIVGLADLLVEVPFLFMNCKPAEQILGVFDMIPVNHHSKVRGFIQGEGVEVSDSFENVRTIAIDSRKVHHDGANAVDELAFILAKMENVLLTKELDPFSSKAFVQLAIDTHFFMEIAKIRAFRILWKAFSSAYGKEADPIPVIATTSYRSFTKADPYVNILRSTNEALAAVLGGADVVSVSPYNAITGPDEHAYRIARNIQLILKEESHLDKVMDPAGGSYAIESLTNELVKRAWDRFLFVSKKGGITSSVGKEIFQEDLIDRRESRKRKLSTRKKILVGTNQYADPTQQLAETEPQMIILQRDAEPFEYRREQLTKICPKIVLLNMGSLREYKPRADFVAGFLAVGGLNVEWSPSLTTATEALDYIKESGAEYAIVCGQDEKVEELLPELLSSIPSNVLIDVAGKPDEAKEKRLKEAGVSGFIYMGQDLLDKFSKLYSIWKGDGTYEQT